MNGLLCQPVWQILNTTGAPVAGAKIYTYSANTANPLATYVSATSSSEASNPLIADANGRLDFWGGPDPYKIVICDADDNVIWSLDYVYVGGTGGSGDGITTVTNIAALRALTTTPALVSVLGYYTKYDGGGGLFRYDSALTIGSDNSGTRIDTAGGKVYMRLFDTNAPVNVRWFGAYGTGLVSDWTAVTLAQTEAAPLEAGFRALLFPSGTYYFEKDFSFTSEVILDPCAILKYAAGKVLTLTPIISPYDYSQHFAYVSTAPEYPVLPTMRIRACWMAGSSKGYMEDHISDKLINGLTLSCAGGIATLTIAAGACAVSDNSIVAYSSGTFTKKMIAHWTVGTGNNGLPSAIAHDGDGYPTATNTWFHVFAITNKQGDVDFGFDTALTATNLLADATKFKAYRRIGSIFWINDTAGTGMIKGFSQYGNTFSFLTPTTQSVITLVSGSHLKILAYVPSGIKTLARFGAYRSDPAGYVYLGSGDATAGTYGVPIDNQYGSTFLSSAAFQLVPTTSQEIMITAEATGTKLYVTVTAFDDLRQD